MATFLVWVAYLNATGYSMDEAVWINIDETPIPYHNKNLRGLRKQPADKTEEREMRCRVPLAKARSKCTMVASIASDETVQKGLPQVLLPQEKGMVKKWDEAATLATTMPRIALIRGSTGWMNNKLMKSYLDILAPAVQAHAGPKKIVLMMDCCTSHVSVKTSGWCEN